MCNNRVKDKNLRNSFEFSGFYRILIIEVNAKNEEYFADVKELLKDMDPSYEDETCYSVLKRYYTDVLSYYDFVSSPTGSFSQLASTLNGHTSKLQTHKNELSFVYED